MPLPILRAYARMLPRLEAEESMLAVQRAQIGGGLQKKPDMRAAMDVWQKTAAGDRKPKAQRPKTAAGHASLARAAGIGVRIVKVPGDA